MFSSYLFQWFDPPSERIRGFRQTAGTFPSGKDFVTRKTNNCIADFHDALIISNKYSGTEAQKKGSQTE
jgi:hypothetical protein